MLSTRVRTFPGQTEAHTWRTALFSSATVGRGMTSMSRIQTDIWSQTMHIMLNWVLAWTPSWPLHDLNIPLAQKSCRVTCCMGWGIVLDVHKVTSKHPRRPWQHLIPRDLDVPMPVHSSIHNDQLTPPSMVDCTPYHDWRATISIIRLGARINKPLRLPTTHPDPTATVV